MPFLAQHCPCGIMDINFGKIIPRPSHHALIHDLEPKRRKECHGKTSWIPRREGRDVVIVAEDLVGTLRGRGACTATVRVCYRDTDSVETYPLCCTKFQEI